MSNELDILIALSDSIKNLEMAIIDASVKVAEQGAESHPILTRLDTYKAIVENQKQYAKELGIAIENSNVEEIVRLISLINETSRMIKDDAREVLAKMHGEDLDEKILN